MTHYFYRGRLLNGKNIRMANMIVSIMQYPQYFSSKSFLPHHIQRKSIQKFNRFLCEVLAVLKI